MKSISVEELQAWRNDGTEHTLIDIREPYEREVGHLDGMHIPMAEVMSRLSDIPDHHPVVIHCRSGARSSAVTHSLETQAGFDNVYNLDGGIAAWAQRIDPSVEVG